MGISGSTKLFPIIGRPVDTVFSPPAYNRWFEEQELDVRMVAMDVAPETLSEFFSFMRSSQTFLGCSVTYPHKQSAFLLCEEVTDRAKRLGALNTIRKLPNGELRGDATDGLAMMSAIGAQGIDVAGKSALILGAGGGAGQAIADALCEKGIAGISLIDTNAQRLAQVTDALRNAWTETRVLDENERHDVLVNATTLGKSPEDVLPFSERKIATAEIVCDVVTGHLDTKLISLAKELDKPFVSGRGMGQHQLEPQMEFLRLS